MSTTYALVKRCSQCGTYNEMKKNMCSGCNQILLKEVILDEIPASFFIED
jgi:hypothetical protein